MRRGALGQLHGVTHCKPAMADEVQAQRNLCGRSFWHLGYPPSVEFFVHSAWGMTSHPMSPQPAFWSDVERLLLGPFVSF